MYLEWVKTERFLQHYCLFCFGVNKYNKCVNKFVLDPGTVILVVNIFKSFRFKLSSEFNDLCSSIHLLRCFIPLYVLSYVYH